MTPNFDQVDIGNRHVTKLSEQVNKEMRLMTAELKAVKIYMLFTRREVRIGKNCAPCLGYRPRPTAKTYLFAL